MFPSIKGMMQVTARDAKTTELKAGETHDVEIAAGGKAFFEILLTRGELYEVSLDKGDLALGLTLYSSAAEQQFSQVSHRYESINIFVPAEITGTYRLELTSLEQRATRNFTVSVRPLRPITTADRDLIPAQTFFARASLLRAEFTESSLREAIEDYDRAASSFRLSKNFPGAAIASMASGETSLVLGNYRDAISKYQTAVTHAKNARTVRMEAQAWSQMGRLHSYLGDNDAAETELVRASVLLSDRNAENQTPAGKQAYAQALTSMGELNYSKGKLVDSATDFEHALRLFNEVGDRDGMARAHLNKGYLAGGAGGSTKAVAEISQALGLFRAVGDKAGEAVCLNALGLSQSLDLDYDQAIRLHREASKIFLAIGDRQNQAITLNTLGQTYEFLHKYPMALQNYQEALRLLKASDGNDIAAVTLFKIGRVFRLIGDTAQAQVYDEESLSLSRKIRKKRTEASALNEMALVYASQGNHQETIRQYRRIFKFYAAVMDRRGQVTALNNLGEFLLQVGDPKAALTNFKQALSLSQQIADNDVLNRSFYNVARANRDVGFLEEALKFVTESIKIIEGLRTNVEPANFRSSYFSGARKNYDLYIDILMQLDGQQPGKGFAAEALLVSENARARSLVDSLTEGDKDARRQNSPQLLTRERELQDELRSQARDQMELSISGKSSPESEELASQINTVRGEYEEIEAQLRTTGSPVSVAAPPTPLTLEQIQAELRKSDTILLEFALGEERSYLWAVTKSGLSSYEIPPRTVLEKAGSELYGLLTARQALGGRIDRDYQSNAESADRSYYEKAERFSQLVLGHVAAQLASRRIIIVSEGSLQYVPWDALPAPRMEGLNEVGNYTRAPSESPLLIGTHEIVSLPSFATLLAIRQEKQKPAARDKVLALVADPVFSSTDDRVKSGPSETRTPFRTSENLNRSQPEPGMERNKTPLRLIHAGEEADSILAMIPPGTAMVARDFDANRETATGPLLGQYQIVHFATHGFFNNDHPELSGIVLSMVKANGNETDGLMVLPDVYRMNLSAQLVVVSGCETALGEDVRGEGIVGLT
ncbi:MAG TPA: CHAT domain-containing tetratricopeptide repeat protein, partial [Pyrinomonadaceae bacterium]|nr:CHAT domain-containing tetratricopeptide repeat protein [Pyrinomonadaceae bacterium]